MPRMSLHRLAPAVLVLVAAAAQAHPDIHEIGLVSHFAPGVHPIRHGVVPDLTHSLIAKVEGKTRVATVGPTEAFVLDGKTSGLTIAGSPADAGPALPKRELSVAAWVSPNAPAKTGGIVGISLAGPQEQKGWWIGHSNRAFTFGLSSRGASNDGDDRMTALVSKTPLDPGRWYYLVAVYDGSLMRLYVNGKLEGETDEESGEILYPEEGAYRIGCMDAANGPAAFDGSIFEVKTYDRALAAAEIEKVAQKNANLIAYQPPKEALTFLVKPYLQFGTTTSMVILCETNRPSTIAIEYAENQPLTKKAATSEAKLISELKLDELTPMTRYFYRVTATDESGATASSALSSFQTAPPPDMPWAFTVIGDTQRNPSVTRRCAEGAYALRPNFMLHCGDVVDNGHAKNQWIQDLLEPMSVLTSRVPMFPVIGNHEKNSHWYYDYFSLPAPEYHYTFHYGNAQFFMIDSNKPLGPSSEQYQWLERELGKSKATWKFACHHHPCFSSDENDYGDHHRGGEKVVFTWGDPNARQLVPLYENYGVDIAWNGHIHLYERTWPIYQMSINQKKGVRYITSGGGGGNLEQAAPQRAWFSLHFKRAFHYCYVTIHDRTIQLKAYDLEGRLFDTFELTKPADR